MPTIPDVSLDDDDNITINDDGDKDIDGGDSSSATLPPDSPEPRFHGRTGSYGASALPNPDTITTDTLEKHMYTADDPPLDLFVRTSGVERLSDFLLWQCHQNTQIFFLQCLWPDFSLKNFIWVLLEWQWRQKQTERDDSPVRTGISKGRRLVE